MNKIRLKDLRRDKVLIFMCIPAIVYYFIFKYIPMYGVLIAFQRYSPLTGIWGSEWVGFKWFLEFFKSFYFFRLIRNTFLLNIYQLFFGFPVPITFALLLNEIRNVYYKKVVQTVSYFPHFISTVIIVGLLFDFLNPDGGIVNKFIGLFGIEPISFMTQKEWFRTVFVASNIWKNFGWGSIVYLAALTSIDQQLYESATIDGASKLQQIFYINIPSLAPTIIILAILRIGRIMSIGFQKVILMYSPAIYETADVISTYVYRKGLLNANYSFGAAVGLFNAIINFCLIMVVNRISRKISQVSLW